MNLKRVPTGPAKNPFEAFRKLVYSTKPEELAALMGCKLGTLYNKADADEGTHHQPTLRDVISATQATGDFQVLDALNEMFGRASFDAGKFCTFSDEALLDLFTTYGAEGGEFCQAVNKALKQRMFTADDFVHIRSEAYDVVAALMTLVTRLEGLVDE
jgi:hypothetical protein